MDETSFEANDASVKDWADAGSWFSDIRTGDTIDVVKMFKYLKHPSFGKGEGMKITADRYGLDTYELQKYMVEKTSLGIPILTLSEALHACVYTAIGRLWRKEVHLTPRW